VPHPTGPKAGVIAKFKREGLVNLKAVVKTEGGKKRGAVTKGAFFVVYRQGEKVLKVKRFFYSPSGSPRIKCENQGEGGPWALLKEPSCQLLPEE